MKLSNWLLTLWVAGRPQTSRTVPEENMDAPAQRDYHKVSAFLCLFLLVMGLAGTFLVHGDGILPSFINGFSILLASIFIFPTLFHFSKILK